ncbi:MAG: glycosyltransferase family 2 protein [Bacteroidota bacterium]
MLKLAIVILNWNGKAFLEKFLPSVVQHCPGYAKVFVADNGSSDGSMEFLEHSYPGIGIIDLKRNFGYTGGYNRSIRQIDAEYYVLLNSDIEVTEGWIDPVIELMESAPGIAACQPKIRSYHQPGYFEYAGASGGFIDRYGYPFCRGRIFESLEQDHGQYDTVTDVFWATGACMFVRAKDFVKAGMLDDEFFAHMEEIDLCWRLKRMGKRIVCVPDSIVYHVGGGTLPKNNPRKTYLNFRNNLFLLARNLPAGNFYPVLIKRLVLDQIAAAKFLLSGNAADCIAVYKALLSVLVNLRRKRRQGKQLPYKPVGEIYQSSIVKEYFLKGRKKFTQLKKDRFVKIQPTR